MAKRAYYRWQNEKRHGLLGKPRKQPRKVGPRGPSGEQTHLIKELRQQLGIPRGPMPDTAKAASLQIKRLLRQADDQQVTVTPARKKKLVGPATSKQLSYIKGLRRAAKLDPAAPLPATKAEASAEIDSLLERARTKPSGDNARGRRGTRRQGKRRQPRGQLDTRSRT